MDSYLLDWLNLLVRWAHVIVSVAWIGASFYFIWLDNALEQPRREADRAQGVGGELWAIHGGGFYHAQKYRVAPPVLPETLHWFKWEAYWTWITGFALLVLMYYVRADLYLIDPDVMPLSTGVATAIGLGSLLAGLVIYEALCRSPLGRSNLALAGVVVVVLAAAAWGLTQVFSGRGAFMQYGAILGTIMVANVALVIIPGQRELVRAKQEGREPDPKYGLLGNQRSVHNTYFTLPVVFVMISNHYAMTFGSRWNWLVLIAFTLSGALIRVWFVMRHNARAPAWPLVAGLLLVAGIAVLIAPRAQPPAERPPFAEVRAVMQTRCASCHAQKPAFQAFAEAPKGVLLDTPERIRAQAMQIYQQSVATKTMPPGNLTAMTDAERALLDRWFRSGAGTE